MKVVLFFFLIGTHPTTPIHVPLGQIMKDIREVVCWYSLGIQLGIGISHLKQIETKYGGDVERCRIELIYTWLRNDSKSTLRRLAQAVEDTGGYANVAQTLRNYYHKGV